jgi:sialate O-acetylesterase
MKRSLKGVFLSAFIFSGVVAKAALTLGSPFGDGMIIQRDKPFVIWGWDSPESTVNILLDGKSATATTDAQGNWRVEIAAPPAGGPYNLTATGTSVATCQDVLCGEVWLASGQSNMVMPLRDSLDVQEALLTADNSNIRFFQVKRTAANSPQKTVQGNWVASNKDTALLFSGVAYHFAAKLQQELNIPIGVIESAWGGSSITAWTPLDVMSADPQYETMQATYMERANQYQAALREWSKGDKKGPRPPSRGGEVQQGLSNLDNGMNNPLKPYSIRGVIWYQGEADASRAKDYKNRFAALVKSWRTSWADPKLPVYFVQLASFDRPVGQEHWPVFRNAQRELANEIPYTDMAVSIDAGDREDIHPKNKKKPGLRLAQLALANTYQFNIVSSGPLPEKADRKDDTVEVIFSRTGGGLKIEGSKPEFTLVDKSGKTIAVEFAIKDTNAVMAKVPNDFDPVLLRYNWEGYPTSFLYNKENLPASPFEVKL